MKHQISTAQYARFLVSNSLFKDLGAEHCKEVAGKLSERFVRAGETLFSCGDPGDEMFIIYSGRFRIFLTQPDGTEAPVRDVGQGETLGEIALLAGARRSARVQAVRDSCLLVLPRAVLEQYVERWPRLALSFTRQQIERLHDVQGATVRSSFCEAVAVIPAGGTRDVGRFSRGLAEELLKF